MRSQILKKIILRLSITLIIFLIGIISFSTYIKLHDDYNKIRQNIAAKINTISQIVTQQYQAGNLILLKSTLENSFTEDEWSMVELIDIDNKVIWKKESDFQHGKHNYQSSLLPRIIEYSHDLTLDSGFTFGKIIINRIIGDEIDEGIDNIINLGLLFSLITLLLLTISTIVLGNALLPINHLTHDLKNEAKKYSIDLTLNDQIDELKNIRNWFKKLSSSWRSAQDKLIENRVLTEKGLLAAQVSHDIKSPLAALEIVIEDLKELPEGSRDLTLNAVNRIQQIADNLSTAGMYGTREAAQSCLISSCIEQIVNEKKLEFKSKKNLKINVHDVTDCTLFCPITAIDLSRLVSNMTNNAAEAMSFKGTISISLSQRGSNLILKISDTGAGFPESILSGPIKRGRSIGKISGQGLGLFHAYQTIKNAQGELRLYNDNGACVEITLPKSKSPHWFCEKISFGRVKDIIIIDDDHTIHTLWKKILKKSTIKMKSIYKPEDFISNDTADLTFVDLDLRSELTGLDLVAKYELKNVVFVTSEYLNMKLQKYCEEHGLTILPKHLIKTLIV